MQFVSANVDELPRSREAALIALESNCLEQHSRSNQNRNCESENGYVDHNRNSVGDSEFAGKDGTRARQVSSDCQCTHERQHADESS